MIEPAQEWLQLAGTMSIFTNHDYAAPEKAAVTGFHVHLINRDYAGAGNAAITGTMSILTNCD